MKNENLTNGTRVVQDGTPYHGIVIDCGTLKNMYMKYAKRLLDVNADECLGTLEFDPDMDVCVVQFDGDNEYAIMPVEDLDEEPTMDEEDYLESLLRRVTRLEKLLRNKNRKF